MSQQLSGTMVPISGRIEDDLYQWFISLDFPGAKSNSDKLREALKELRRQHEAADDLIKARAWMQARTDELARCLALIDQHEMKHSEVFTVLTDAILSMAASLISARPGNAAAAAQVEEQLVRRALALTEALLRQALTPTAAAFDPDVVRRHSARIVELAVLIQSTRPGDNNG